MACALGNMTVGLIVAATVAASAAGAAAATPRGFEVKGFVQGMHRNEAREVAHRNGYELHESQSGTVISKGGRGDLALFCRDELVRYAYATRGGFMKFLNQIKDLEGNGFRRTNLDLGTQMGSDGKEQGHLTIYFFRPGDPYFATVTLRGNEDYDTYNFTVQYEALDRAAKCQQ